MKPTRRFFLVLLSVFMLAAAVCGCADPAADAQDAAQEAIEVRIAYPERMDLSRETEFVGRVESGTSVNIFAEVPAKILHTYKHIGEYVAEGELLMEVDDTDMQNALLSAQSALTAANLSYQQTQATQAISTSGSAYITKQLTNGKTLDDLVDKYYETLRSGRQLDNTLDDYYIALHDAQSAKKKAQDAFAPISAETAAKAGKWYQEKDGAIRIFDGISSDGFLSFIKGEASPQMELEINNVLTSYPNLSEEIYQQRVKYTTASGAMLSTASAEGQAKAALEAYEKQYDSSSSTIDSSIRSITKNYDYYAKTYNIADTLGTAETQALNGITLATLRLSCENAQRSVESAQSKVDKCKLYAPVSGTITAKNAVESNFANSATPMYVIAADKSAPVIAFNVSEDGADALGVGSKLTVIANGEAYEASVTEMSNTTNAGSGLYAAKASLPLDAGLERTGTVVKVRVSTAHAENVLALPLDYIEYDENQPYVLVYRDGTAVRCDLELGMSTRDSVEIVNGISLTDAVITTWHPELRNGSLVSCPALSSSIEAEAASSNTDSIEVIE